MIQDKKELIDYIVSPETTKKILDSMDAIQDIDIPLFSLIKAKEENKHILTIKQQFSHIMAMNLAGMVYDLCKQYPDLILEIRCLAESKIITNSSIN